MGVRGALGRYRQYVHSFDVATFNATALVPHVRFWLPVGRDQRPPEAYHASAAFLYRPDDVWQLGAEAYYKHQPHLLVLDYGGSREHPAPGDVLTGADGYAYGLGLTSVRKGDARAARRAVRVRRGPSAHRGPLRRRLPASAVERPAPLFYLA